MMMLNPPDLEEFGLAGLELGTCSYRAFTPDMGVPVRTSVGLARGFKFPHEFVSELAPYGIFRNAKYADATTAEKRIAYNTRIAGKVAPMLAKLAGLRDSYPGARLVLLCWENVHAGEECHRRWAADWLESELGLIVPELSPCPPSHSHQEQLAP